MSKLREYNRILKSISSITHREKIEPTRRWVYLFGERFGDINLESELLDELFHKDLTTRNDEARLFEYN